MERCQDFIPKDINKYISDHFKPNNCKVDHNKEYERWLLKHPKYIDSSMMHTCYKCDNATNNEEIRLKVIKYYING